MLAERKEEIREEIEEELDGVDEWKKLEGSMGDAERVIDEFIREEPKAG